MQPADGFTFVVQPELKTVSDLICKSWARPCWNYDEGLLKLHIMRPTGDPTLAVGQQSDDGRLASFQAYMPFNVNYCGSEYRAVFASFLTVSPDFQGRGVAGPQQGILIEKAIEKDYDLYITMCEVGAASNRAVEKVFAKKGLDVQVVNILNYLASPSEVAAPVLPAHPSIHTRPYQVTDQTAVAGLVKDMGGDAPLRKLIPEEDFDFLLNSRPHTKTFLYEKDGCIRGLINVLLLEVLDTRTSLNVYFDNVTFGDMALSEQEEFVGDVLLALQKERYHIAFMPSIGYVSTEAFKKYRFRAAPRQINLYIAPLKEGILPGGIRPVDSFFLDVY